MTNDNPFAVNAYLSPQLFCDREQETATIASALRNGRHVMLYSPRRYGKTGLIHHVFNTLARARGARTGRTVRSNAQVHPREERCYRARVPTFFFQWIVRWIVPSRRLSDPSVLPS